MSNMDHIVTVKDEQKTFETVYLKNAKQWDDDRFQRTQRESSERKIWAITFAIISVCLSISIWVIMPLKEYKGVYFEKDPVTKSYKKMSYDTHNLMTISTDERNYWVSLFVSNFESWNVQDNKLRVKKLTLMSSRRVFNMYDEEQNIGNKNAHSYKLGKNVTRIVQVYSFTSFVSQRKNNIAIRFYTEDIDVSGKVTKKYWSGIVTYSWKPNQRYTQLDRLMNPKGFLVHRYTRRPEVINAKGVTQ